MTRDSILVIYHSSKLNPRTRLYVNSLVDNGFDIDILTLNRGISSEQEESDSDLSIDSIHLPTSHASLRDLLLFPYLYILLVYIAWTRSKEYDLIYCSHIMFLPVSVVLKYLLGTRVFFDVHENYRAQLLDRSMFGAAALVRAINVVEHVALPRVDGLLVIDSADDLLYDHYRKYTDNIAITYNVPQIKPLTERDSNKEKDQDENSEPNSSGNDDSLSIVYAGRLVQDRGVLPLAQATLQLLEKKCEVKLVLIGPDIDGTRDKIARMFAEQGLSDHVTFTGPIPYAELHSSLERMDLGVVPYDRTINNRQARGNSRKLFDYMNASLPIIAPCFSGVREIVEKGNCGVLTDTTDPDAMARDMVTLIDDSDLREKYRKNSRRHFIEEYAFDNEREKLRTVVKRSIQDSQ